MKTSILFIIFLISLSALGQRNDLTSKRNYGEQLLKQKFNHLGYYVKNKLADNAAISFDNIDLFRMKSAATAKQNLDSVITWWMDEETGLLVPFMKGEYAYNTDGKITQEIHHFRNDNTQRLMQEIRLEYSYETQGNISQILVYAWAQTNQWTYENKITNSFNASNKITEQLSYSWSIDANNWVKDEKYEFKYDADGNLLQELYYNWDQGANEFITEWKDEYSYNTSGRLTQEMSYYWDTDFSRWLNTNKTTHTYNASNEKTLSQYFSLNGSNQMMAIGKTEYTFSNGLVSQTIHYEWDEGSNQWFIVGRYDYTYDAFGNMEQELGYDWDEYASQYINGSKIDVSYDLSYLISEINFPLSLVEDDDFFSGAIHKMDSVLGLFWDEDTNDWLTFLKSVYYYSESNVSLVDDINNPLIKVFPNPVKDNLYINISGSFEPFSFELLDISGHSLLNKYLTNYSPVNLKELSPGIYFYRIISSGNDEMRGKLIKD